MSPWLHQGASNKAVSITENVFKKNKQTKNTFNLIHQGLTGDRQESSGEDIFEEFICLLFKHFKGYYNAKFTFILFFERNYVCVHNHSIVVKIHSFHLLFSP